MSSTLRLPGLIDPHVHLRDPGHTHKEDFQTGTSAALAGGYTTIFDMPNNLEPITTRERLEAKRAAAKDKIVCDLGFHFGTLGDNFGEFDKVIRQVRGLKVYLNVTTGNFIIDKDKLADIYSAWPEDKPILLHAESDVSDLVLSTLRKVPRRTHICHVSSEAELRFVLAAKDEGLPITCGVTPHHLFLSAEDAAPLGTYAYVKPRLKPQADIDFLWKHMDGIDIVESDHAPHTREEKESETPAFGLPGLETTLALMLTAQQSGKISDSKLRSLLHDRVAEIFDVPEDPDTFVDVQLGDYIINNEHLFTKCGWSPFAGMHVAGKVQRVTLHGAVAFENGQVLAAPGSGRLV